MSVAREQIVQHIREAGVVAVLRAESKDQLVDIVNALLAGGVYGIEVTTSTPNAIEGITMLADRFGERALLGVGTVLEPRTAIEAAGAGARFVVSPTFDPLVLEAAHSSGAACCPGAFTPTEILKAHHAGADVVKVFPSTALGPAYFKDILAPLPFLKLMPTGGVTAGNVTEWIKAGAVCVGAGSALVPRDAVRNRDWKTITSLAESFSSAVRLART
jgi:2-dehydro-3-deoxyphosphogluconate aldolase/(4S)-4-hydroxy-2-oxoglutarate aldolase